MYFKIFSVLFRRAKEKRLNKDAGRARWGQYFRFILYYLKEVLS